MRILELQIKGFRSFREATWRPGDLNVLIGPNASGKSNLIQVVEFIRAAASGRLRDFVDREGGMGRLVWDGQDERIVVAHQKHDEYPHRQHRRHCHHCRQHHRFWQHPNSSNG